MEAADREASRLINEYEKLPQLDPTEVLNFFVEQQNDALRRVIESMQKMVNTLSAASRTDQSRLADVCVQGTAICLVLQSRMETVLRNVGAPENAKERANHKAVRDHLAERAASLQGSQESFAMLLNAVFPNNANQMRQQYRVRLEQFRAAFDQALTIP